MTSWISVKSKINSHPKSYWKKKAAHNESQHNNEEISNPTNPETQQRNTRKKVIYCLHNTSQHQGKNRRKNGKEAFHKQGQEEGLKGGERSGKIKRMKTYCVQGQIPCDEFYHCVYLNCTSQCHSNKFQRN